MDDRMEIDTLPVITGANSFTAAADGIRTTLTDQAAVIANAHSAQPWGADQVGQAFTQGYSVSDAKETLEEGGKTVKLVADLGPKAKKAALMYLGKDVDSETVVKTAGQKIDGAATDII